LARIWAHLLTAAPPITAPTRSVVLRPVLPSAPKAGEPLAQARLLPGDPHGLDATDDDGTACDELGVSGTGPPIDEDPGDPLDAGGPQRGPYPVMPTG
jgi:hypothetical protein